MTNEMITLSNDTAFPVDGRLLHERLEVGTQYRDWFPRMCGYGFTEGVDFRSKMSETSPAGGRPAINHELTVGMAKEICMLQRTEKGREVRRHLIALENQWNTPEAVIARALQMANEKLSALSGSVLQLEDAIAQKDQVIGELQPKADYVDTILSSVETMTISQIAADYSISGKRLNRLLCEARIQRKVNGQWILYAEHMGKGYTESETIPITHSDGRAGSRLFTRWTQKGRLMINAALNDRGVFAVAKL